MLNHNVARCGNGKNDTGGAVFYFCLYFRGFEERDLLRHFVIGPLGLGCGRGVVLGGPPQHFIGSGAGCALTVGFSGNLCRGSFVQTIKIVQGL